MCVFRLRKNGDPPKIFFIQNLNVTNCTSCTVRNIQVLDGKKYLHRHKNLRTKNIFAQRPFSLHVPLRADRFRSLFACGVKIFFSDWYWYWYLICYTQSTIKCHELDSPNLCCSTLVITLLRTVLECALSVSSLLQ